MGSNNHKQFKVAVVTANYNNRRYLDQWNYSLSIQDTKVNWMRVVVDDSSDDGSWPYLQKLQKESKREFLLKRTSINSGHCSKPYNIAFNTAYEYADYVYKVDSDDYLEASAIEQMYELARSSDADFVCSHFKTTDGTIVPVQEGLTWQDFRNANRLSAFAMWKTRSWKAVGNFSETIGYEDWDWWIRALKMGMKYRVLSKPVYNYRIHESQQTNIMKGRYNEIVNELKLLHFN